MTHLARLTANTATTITPSVEYEVEFTDEFGSGCDDLYDAHLETLEREDLFDG